MRRKGKWNGAIDQGRRAISRCSFGKDSGKRRRGWRNKRTTGGCDCCPIFKLKSHPPSSMMPTYLCPHATTSNTLPQQAVGDCYVHTQGVKVCFAKTNQLGVMLTHTTLVFLFFVDRVLHPCGPVWKKPIPGVCHNTFRQTKTNQVPIVGFELKL